MEKRIEELKNGIINIENERKQLLANAEQIKNRLIELNNSQIATLGAIQELEKLANTEDLEVEECEVSE